MEQIQFENEKVDLSEISKQIKEKLVQKQYAECINAICKVMHDYPHAPQPHNWLGLILEENGDHAVAMKHFRAAWALDPTYLPARINLEVYGTFNHSSKSVFDEDDYEVPVIKEKYFVKRFI